MEEKGNLSLRETKSNILYIILFAAWIILGTILWYKLIQGILYPPFKLNVIPSTFLFVIARVLLIFNGLFITYFWLNGVKDFIYVIWYFSFRSKMLKCYSLIINKDVSFVKDKVLMVYCTCNDFDEKSLKKSMMQDYKFVRTVILDDSSDEAYKRRINSFARKNGIKVVRREKREGFKAGNINNYLLSDECKEDGDFDYVVILDSDEIVPSNFVAECLKYFYSCKDVGIVQASHVSTRNRNFFMKLFHIGVNSHWQTYQTMKHFYGFSTMLGHGAMIKKECYLDSNGFPSLVAEDLCISIEARNKGWFVAFAPNIVCQEEYPIDYLAFKKRHSKWTQGNLEFIKKYTGKIIKSNMNWYEKCDIVLFTYNLPLTAMFVFYIFLNLVIMPYVGLELSSVFEMWMLIPTIIFFFSPMLNDVFFWLFRINILRFLLYFFMVIILYGSMLTTSLLSALLGMFGKKAVFIVTPKTSQKISLALALKSQLPEFIFSTILLLLAFLIQGTVLPIILIVLTGYLSFILVFFSSVQYDKRRTKEIDKETILITLSQNIIYIIGS